MAHARRKHSPRPSSKPSAKPCAASAIRISPKQPIFIGFVSSLHAAHAVSNQNVQRPHTHTTRNVRPFATLSAAHMSLFILSQTYARAFHGRMSKSARAVPEPLNHLAAFPRSHHRSQSSLTSLRYRGNTPSRYAPSNTSATQSYNADTLSASCLHTHTRTCAPLHFPWPPSARHSSSARRIARQDRRFPRSALFGEMITASSCRQTKARPIQKDPSCTRFSAPTTNTTRKLKII